MKIFKGEAYRCIVFLQLVFILVMSLPALGDESCFREYATVDYSDITGRGKSAGLEHNIFRHVFVSTEDYPYFRHERNAFIGIESWPATKSVYDDFGWYRTEGRAGIGKGHFSLIENFIGEIKERMHGFNYVALAGVKVDINRDNFAFFLYPRDGTSAVYYAHALPNSNAEIATMVDDEEIFIKRHFYPFHAKWMSISDPPGTSGTAHDRIQRWFSKKIITAFRFDEKSTRIAGVTKTARRLCGMEGRVLVATGSDYLVPMIERQLKIRAAAISAEDKLGQSEPSADEFRALFNSLPDGAWVPILSIPPAHKQGDYEYFNDFGKVEVRFARDPYDTFAVGVHEVYSSNLGTWDNYYASVEGTIWINGQRVEKTAGCIRASTPVNSQIGQYVKRQQYTGVSIEESDTCRARCSDEFCEVLVRKRLIPADLPQNSSAIEAKKRQQAEIDRKFASRKTALNTLKNLSSDKDEWLEAFQKVPDDTMIPVIRLPERHSKQKYVYQHPALGRVAVRFHRDIGSKPYRNIKTKRVYEPINSKSQIVDVYGYLEIDSTIVGTLSEIAIGRLVLASKKRDRKLYKQIKRKKIKESELERLYQKAPIGVSWWNSSSNSRFKVRCYTSDTSYARYCTVAVSKALLKEKLTL